MRMRIAAVTALVALLGAARVQAMQDAAVVQAAKGPVQITFRLQKTTVHLKRYLWYKLELKNIGKEKIQLDEKVFKSPYAMHVNSDTRVGLYLEIVDPEGELLTVKPGNYRVRNDWEGTEGGEWEFSAAEKEELSKLREKWKKSSMTDHQRSLAFDAWVHKLRKKKEFAELTDPAHKHWLIPGASTRTFAWSERGPGDYPGRSEDDESLRQGYAELFSYRFLDPGKYRIRAVFNHSQPAEDVAYYKKAGKLPAHWVKFKTAFVNFEVIP